MVALGLTAASCHGADRLAGVAVRNVAQLARTPARVAGRTRTPYRADARLAVLWIGHATVLVQMDDRFVLSDPVFTRTVGQFSPRLIEPGLDVRDVPPVEFALISHLHFDHLSLESLHRLQDRIGQLIVPEDGLVYVPPYRFDAVELPTWESVEHNGMRVTAVPVRHEGWRYGADQAWMTRSFSGYVIEYHGLTVYFAGDTRYAHDDFVAAASRFPRIDVALLPIAPLEPREFMASRHMDAAEAVQAFRDLHARWMVPIHFDTFINSADHVGDATAALARAVSNAHLEPARVHVLHVGETFVAIAR